MTPYETRYLSSYGPSHSSLSLVPTFLPEFGVVSRSARKPLTHRQDHLDGQGRPDTGEPPSIMAGPSTISTTERMPPIDL